jgi:hypothetical protein
MNSLVESEFPLHATQRVRYDLMQTLTDSDLAYQLPGDNPTLGALCREFGDVEYAYIQSFKTFKHDWSCRTTEAELATSVARLQAWYTTLDTEFETVKRILLACLLGAVIGCPAGTKQWRKQARSVKRGVR